MWRYDGTSLVDIVQYPVQKNSTNFRCIIPYDGFIYTHMMGRVLKIALTSGTVSSLVDITPEMKGTAVKELYGHGKPTWMYTGPFVLYAAFNDGRATSGEGYPELMAYSGSGWHQRYLGTTAGKVMAAAGYSSNLVRSHINLQADGTLFKKMISLRDIPFPSYPATGQFETSDYTGDLPFMQKAFRSLNVEARSLDVAKGRNISVSYSPDKGATYVAMGTVTTNGRTNLPFKPTTSSTLSDSATVNSNSIRLKFTLTQGTVETAPTPAVTPVLVRYTVDFLNRPLATHAHSANLRLGTTMTLRDGTLETISVEERLQFIAALEDSESPIRFIDMTGRHYLVYMTKTSIAKVEKEGEDERMVSIVMVDAITGLWPQVFRGVTMSVAVTATLYDAAVYDTDIFGTGRFG